MLVGFYAKGRDNRPARILAKQGLILYSRLDVAAAAATAIQLPKLRITIGGKLIVHIRTAFLYAYIVTEKALEKPPCSRQVPAK